MNRTFLFCITCIMGIFLCAPAAGATEKLGRVMIVHSYDMTDICGDPQALGVVEGLGSQGWQEGKNLVVRSFYMDTKKKFTTPEAIKERGRLALDAITAFAPDVVLVLDDNAIREVMLPLAGRENVSVVFSGMNGQPEDYNNKQRFMASVAKPGGNITGVYEKLYVYKSLVVMKSALSQVFHGEKVVGITDSSPTGIAINRQFELELQGKDLPLGWEHRRVQNFEEYKALIAELNKDEKVKAIYPAALSLKTSQGETYTAGEILKYTQEHSIKPEMALNYYFSKIGLFGGAAVDFVAMGRLAGVKAGKILNGEKAGDLPIEDAPEYAIVFNVDRAKTLNITIPEALLTAADNVYQLKNSAK